MIVSNYAETEEEDDDDCTEISLSFSKSTLSFALFEESKAGVGSGREEFQSECWCVRPSLISAGNLQYTNIGECI